MTVVNPVHPAALGLLALVPVAAYAASLSTGIVALSAVCVVVIAGSLYTMFGSDEEPSAHA